jgi:membrane protein YdbS with pleckstrin-like domain
LPTLGRTLPFIVLPVTTGDDQPWLHPSPSLWRMRRAEVVTISLVLAALFGLLFLAAQGPLAGLISVVVVAVLGATLSWFLRRRFRAWRYQERHEDLIVARGVMVQRLSVVPYGRMQFVEVTAGPVERLFGLSTVKLHTAAAASDARIPGLEQDEAARLRDRLTELGESMAAGM